MQKVIVPVVIFIAVLIALMFGEGLLSSLLSFLEDALGFFLDYWRMFYTHVADFVVNNPYKLLLALVITAIASLWIFKRHGDELNSPTNRRKFAVVLAIFLGWLGAHRFYLGQYGKGIVYILISAVFAPLSVLLSFIDAVRFLAMDDAEFRTHYPL
ncbi:TM2 domain-containing protein [Pelistega europaea]|uniref:TM2 domain-containing protein n=1 Tax=Pelistega europaea TaxID=106147 RepID=A0A7Y4LA21_9BURK|nr:TM2 domain-containing protein [Pelistega europaea]NOL49698.1 TM2 domain-containing protein [Pelistega europaea]